MPTPNDGLTIPLPPGASPPAQLAKWTPKSLGANRSERSRWQALRHLLLEQWEPPPRDERPLRWIAGTFSLLLNLLFAILLIYFMVLQYLAMHAADDEEQQAVMVEFIGRGKRQLGGGDSTPSAPPVSSSKASSSAAIASASAAAVSQPTPAASTTPPTAQQPARVPTPAPNVTLSKPVEDLSPFRVPVASAPQSAATSRSLAVQSPQLSERSVSDPMQAPDLRPVASPQRTVSESIAVRPSASLSERSVRDPAPAAASTAPSTAAAPSTTAGASTSTNRATARGTSNTPSTTAGPNAAAQSGGWYQNATADDWGNSNRERPGQKQGARDGQTGLQGNDLFDEQGKPKLPYKGSASRNDPPGLVNGEVRDLDRVGTWRKRRPTDANLPGSSMVWLPHETLLDEWVRRGIKEVRVRIPGTTTTIRCKVSVLALGGACGLTDPNLEDQEVIARPPPSVPFKSELNQHNGGRREDQKVEDFGPGAIMPGQAIKPVGKDALPPSPQSKKPAFKFGDEK